MTQTSSGKKNPSDKYAASVFLESARMRRKFVAKHPLDYGEAAEFKDREGAVTFFATADDIAKLEKEGHAVERGQNLSALGRERMSEIAKGDRFADGKTLPLGLGRKMWEQ